MKAIELLCLVLVLMFAAAGCENKLNKLPEATKPTEPTEPTKSLYEAAASGDIDKVKFLIAKGADINAGEWTALHAAVHAQKKDIAELLIAKGADVNAKDGSDSTPLYYAIWKDDKDLVRLLVDKGADVSFTREKGYPPLHYAVWYEDNQMVVLFVANGAKFDVKDRDGWTAFRYAASQENRGLVEFFVDKGADVSSFHTAACVGDLTRVRRFVEQGTDVDTKDEFGWTPLYWAASTSQEDVAEFLIAKGADIAARTEDSSTPLHQAAKAGDRKIVELFITKGADVNAKAKNENTPLHSAASAGQRQVVELLIAKGADVNAKNDAGQTPLDVAIGKNRKEIVELLVEKGAIISLHTFVNSGDLDMLRRLIEDGADVNAKDDYGQTPLHCAVVIGHKDIVEFLLAKGAHVDAGDNAGRTPLHYAVGAGKNRTPKAGHTDVVLLLLDKGDKINTKDKWGWTPLHYAVCMANKAMVELLVNRGADLNATNDRGRTALSVARGMSTRFKGHPRESEAVSKYSEIADLLRKGRCIYYVASGGKDSNPGTFQHPFKTIDAAIDVTEQDDTIFVRGGLHSYSSTICINKSGQKGKPIRLRAYSGETPVFDFSASKGCGFVITGAYWHINGLTVTGAEYHGMQLETKEAHHNIIEQTTTHANGCNGIDLRNGASHNLLLNCDSYQNFDPETDGENADGFVAACSLGRGNVLIGCRAWNNADDGFDFWMAGEGVRVENCYAFHNGQNIWAHPCFTGNANGFKLGKGLGRHVLIDCVAWDHGFGGFNLNGNETGVILYGCTAFKNSPNYRFPGYNRGIDNCVLRNNISAQGKTRDGVGKKADSQFNSWNAVLNLTITDSDFLSIDDSVMSAPRNPDGSIPENDFLKLAPGSSAIDRGVDVNIPFSGNAPDLGTFEYRPLGADKRSTGVLHQAVRDRDIKQIRALLSKGADVNEKDWLGYAPLPWACYFGYSDLVELLLTKGANPNLISDTGRTPLEIATEMDYENIAELLNKHGAKE